MDKTKLVKLVTQAKSVTRKHSPEILTGLGIAGMITGAIMAVKATPKALDIMADIKEQHMEDTDKKAYSKDIITKVAPVYIPSVLVGGISIACLIGASSVNMRRNAALATAYSLSETALREYQEKVVETIGEKKEEAVRSAVAKDNLDRNPVVNNEIIITGNGDTLCYDLLCKRYFTSNVDKLRKIENELNRRMRSENYISLNEFYYEVGLDDMGLGYEFGWNIDKGYIELEFSAQLVEKDGKEVPCIVVGFANKPDYDYR